MWLRMMLKSGEERLGCVVEGDALITRGTHGCVVEGDALITRGTSRMCG